MIPVLLEPLAEAIVDKPKVNDTAKGIKLVSLTDEMDAVVMPV